MRLRKLINLLRVSSFYRQCNKFYRNIVNRLSIGKFFLQWLMLLLLTTKTVKQLERNTIWWRIGYRGYVYIYNSFTFPSNFFSELYLAASRCRLLRAKLWDIDNLDEFTYVLDRIYNPTPSFDSPRIAVNFTQGRRCEYSSQFYFSRYCIPSLCIQY